MIHNSKFMIRSAGCIKKGDQSLKKLQAKKLLANKLFLICGEDLHTLEIWNREV